MSNTSLSVHTSQHNHNALNKPSVKPQAIKTPASQSPSFIHSLTRV